MYPSPVTVIGTHVPISLVPRQCGRRETAWYRLLMHVWLLPIYFHRTVTLHSLCTWNNIQTRYSKVVYTHTKLKKELQQNTKWSHMHKTVDTRLFPPTWPYKYEANIPISIPFLIVKQFWKNSFLWGKENLTDRNPAKSDKSNT